MPFELVFLTTPYVDDGRLQWSVCNQGDAPAPAFAVVGTYGVWDEQGTGFQAKTDYQVHTEIQPATPTTRASISLGWS